MRVGINCFFLQPHVGGMKHYVLNLLHLLLTGDTGNTYTLFCFPHNESVLAERGADWWQQHAVVLDRIEQIREHLADIDVYFSPINGLQPLPLPPIPTVITVPDVQESTYPQFFDPKELFYRDWYHRVSCQLADQVITTSQFSKKAIVQFYGAHEDRVAVIHPGIDERMYSGQIVGRKPQAELPADYALYPGNRWRHKNHDILMAAIRKLRRTYGMSVNLVCTGRDVEAGVRLRDIVRRYDIADLVYDLGYVTAEEMIYLYQRARLLVFPSLYEGFGMPLLEAMASGCPVVAAKETSLPEVAGDAALYFDPRDVDQVGEAIRQVWNNEKEGASLSQLGRTRAQAFSPKDTVSAHLKAFERARAQFSLSRYRFNMSLLYPYHLARVGAKRALGVYGRQSHV